ncbi:MAG: hypothetical protein WC121_13815 [Candidatus Kapaibacterium sp.]
MIKLLILILILIILEYSYSETKVLRSEKSIDSGKLFTSEKSQEIIKDYNIIEIPKSQLLYDKNKDVNLVSNDGGKTWFKKEVKITNSYTVSSDSQLIELLPKDIQNLRVSNINGSTVENDLNTLVNGIYFIQFINNNMTHFYKVMVLK